MAEAQKGKITTSMAEVIRLHLAIRGSVTTTDWKLPASTSPSLNDGTAERAEDRPSASNYNGPLFPGVWPRYDQGTGIRNVQSRL